MGERSLSAQKYNLLFRFGRNRLAARLRVASVGCPRLYKGTVFRGHWQIIEPEMPTESGVAAICYCCFAALLFCYITAILYCGFAALTYYRIGVLCYYSFVVLL